MVQEFGSILWLKKWSVTDNAFFYGGKEYPYEKCSNITITTAATPFANGAATVVLDNKSVIIGFLPSDNERAIQAIAFANNKIDEAKGIVKNYKFCLKAHTGSTLEVYEDYIILTFMHTGSAFVNNLKGGANGGKRIKIRDITAVQFREPAGMVVGFIQFTFPGSGENKNGVVSSINDENSIPVSPANAALAKSIVDYIEARRDELSAPIVVSAAPAAFSQADELKKFKELLDLGIITEEEFEAKKKQLLGL